MDPMKKMPKGKPTAAQVDASGIKNTMATFARMFELAQRLKQLQLDPCAILGVKPWEAPSVGTITEEQFAKLDAAAAAAEANKPVSQ